MDLPRHPKTRIRPHCIPQSPIKTRRLPSIANHHHALVEFVSAVAVIDASLVCDHVRTEVQSYRNWRLHDCGYQLRIITRRYSCALAETRELHIGNILALGKLTILVLCFSCYTIIDDVPIGLVHESTVATFVTIVVGTL